MNDKRFSYASGGFCDRDIFSALDAIAGVGFSQVELLGQKPHVEGPPKGKQLKKLIHHLDSVGLKVPTVHAPLGKNTLAAPDEQWHRAAMETLAEYIEFTAEVHALAMIVHPVPFPDFVPEASQDDLINRAVEFARRSLDELLPIAQHAGVCLLLENLPFACNYPLLTMKELRPLIDTYPKEHVGLVMDTGHALLLREDPVEEIILAGDRLRGVHLHDANGTIAHLPPMFGQLDWQAVLVALKKVDYCGAWTFEVGCSKENHSPEDLAKMCYQFSLTWANSLEESSSEQPVTRSNQ